jgi:putative hydrolase of the HAD superfamily
MTNGSPRAIAFDLFHTLVDPEEFRPPDFHRAPAVARLLGLPEKEFTEAWEAAAHERQLSLAPTVVERVQALCREFGVSPRAELWPEVSDLLGRITDLAILNPRRSVLRTLRQLKEQGWTLGVLSNCDERERRKWNDSELATLVDAAVFSCEVGAAKPSLEAYRALVPRWGGIPLHDAVFVGDGMNNEIPGARRAGFAKVLFQSQFVSVNGLRTPEANDAIRATADGALADLGDLIGLFPEPPSKS